LLVLLTEGSSIKVRVFQDREEAAKWLGVSIELVAPKTVDGGEPGRAEPTRNENQK
jgi:hypothetical protein